MSQINIFGEKEVNRNIVNPGKNLYENAELHFYPDFITTEKSNHFFELLLSTVEWKQEGMKMYGKTVNFPRLTAWYGDRDKPYSFSGITLHPLEWTNELLNIQQQLLIKTGLQFNSVLLNRYRNGNDSISWHSDGEPELGQNPTIASVNFGEARTFELKHNTSGETITVVLPHGSMLLMAGETQHFWKHRVAKTSKSVKERINLTFRILK